MQTMVNEARKSHCSHKVKQEPRIQLARIAPFQPKGPNQPPTRQARAPYQRQQVQHSPSAPITVKKQ
ncbi:hypothetical protein KSS87_012359 [Heliosperma pusillum]|nr:hypothetical protein KSS87_012359 [Heliosperma pusillum]